MLSGRNMHSEASMKHDICPDCGVPIGENHEDGCDVERCPHCGGQALGCVGFDPSDPRRQPWDGRWPGEADCERLGFFVGGDRAFPDINRLFAEMPLELRGATVGARPTGNEQAELTND
jgi:hypothetical protein